MTAIGYDTEFLEDGRTIDLISIGLVREDGAEYYAIVKCLRLAGSWLTRIGDHPWLMEHVVPTLPLAVDKFRTRGGGTWNSVKWDTDHPDYVHVKDREVIAAEVREFILGNHPDMLPHVELWADYGAYDHVALCQLWGSMVSLPEGIPMWTHDLRQEAERAGVKEPPAMPGATGHNALDDAREVMFRLRWLREHAAGL